MKAGTDRISLAAFLAEVRRRGPRGTLVAREDELRDPLAAIGARMAGRPHTMEHRVLARILRGIIKEPNDDTFRKTEISALGPSALLLLSALIDDLTGGRYDRAAVRSVLVMNGISTPAGDQKTPLG